MPKPYWLKQLTTNQVDGSASYNDPLESGHPDRSNPDRLRYGSPNNYLDGIRMGHPDRYDEPPDYGSGGDPDALW